MKEHFIVHEPNEYILLEPNQKGWVRSVEINYASLLYNVIICSHKRNESPTVRPRRVLGRPDAQKATIRDSGRKIRGHN